MQRNLRVLVERGQLRPAMALSLELMDRGSYQVEMSEEGLMSEEVEACLRVVLSALGKCDLPAAEVASWCVQMHKRDRVGFLCDKDLEALRRHIEASRSP